MFLTNYLLVILFGILVYILKFTHFLKYCRKYYYILKLPGPSTLELPKLLFTYVTARSNIERSRIFMQVVNDNPPILWIVAFPMLIVSDADIGQKVLNNVNSLNRDPTVVKYLTSIVGDSIATAVSDNWKKKRNKLIRGFNPLILKEYFNVFVDQSNTLVKCMQNELNKQKSFDVFDYLFRASIDSAMTATMGVQVNCQKNGLSLFEDAMKGVTGLINDRVYKIWTQSDLLYSKTNDYINFNNYSKIIMDTANMVLTKRREIREKHLKFEHDFKNSLLNYLLNVNAKQSEYTDEQLMGEINAILLGATETSSLTLSYTLLHLAANKDLQNKVYNEIYSIFGNSNRTIELDDLKHLEYMEMVLKESLRMYPAVPIITRYVTKDIEAGQYLIPNGSQIAVSIFHIQRNEKYWKDPLTYDPERFSIDNMKNHHPNAYVPFSAGPRNCIGGKYALLFMKATLTTLLREYEFHTNLNVNEFKFVLSLSLKLDGGHQVTITRRSNTISI